MSLDKLMLEDLELYNKLKADLKKEIMSEINPTLQDLGKNMLEIKHALAPMAEVFNNTSAFAKITILILKFVALAGAGLGVLYALLKWLRQ